MPHQVSTVTEYINSLPLLRRPVIRAVRRVIKANLPAGYREVMQYGMITYVVPLTLYPAGYLGKKDVPLPYLALASQKNYLALYLMNIYGDKKAEEWFKREYQASGKKLDMGKSCLRFRRLEDLPLDLIGQAVARTSPAQFIKIYEQKKGRTR